MTAELVELRPQALPAPTDTDSWTGVVAQVGQLAAMIADTDFVPDAFKGNAPAVAAAILYGREVGLPPMTALTQVFVQKGRPGMYAEGMRALVLAAGHDLEVREMTGATCTVAGRRRGETRWREPVTWNLDMARAAGLIRDKSAWQTFPRAMLLARATAELCRIVFPDVIHGFRALEELDDTGADTDRETPSGPAPTPKTTVRRQTARKPPSSDATPPAGQPPAPTPERPPVSDTTAAGGPPAAPPPLPGEPGYDTPEDSAAGVPGESLPAAETSPATPPVEAGDPDAVATPVPDSSGAATADGDDIQVVDEPDPRLPRNYRTKVILEFGRLGVTNREHRLAYCSVLVGRDITTSNQLTKHEAHQVLETLAMCPDRDALDQVANATEQHQLQIDVPE